MTWCEDSPATHAYRLAEAPLSVKRRLDGGLGASVTTHLPSVL